MRRIGFLFAELFSAGPCVSQISRKKSRKNTRRADKPEKVFASSHKSAVSFIAHGQHDRSTKFLMRGSELTLIAEAARAANDHCASRAAGVI